MNIENIEVGMQVVMVGASQTVVAKVADVYSDHIIASNDDNVYWIDNVAISQFNEEEGCSITFTNEIQ